MNTSKYIANDILGRQQNWINKVASFRVSNVRIGQHITSLLKDQNNTTTVVDDSLFKVSFTKITKLKDHVYTIMGGKSGIRVWRTSTRAANSLTELIYEDHCAAIDACFAPTSTAFKVYTLLPHEDGHVVKLLSIPPSTSREVVCSGTAEALRVSSGYLLVSLAAGVLRILDNDTMEAVTQVVSIPETPVVCAVSTRWLALQIEQSSGVAIGNKGGNDVQDTALRLVSGLYVLSRVSWKAVSPYLHRAAGDNVPEPKTSTPRQTGGGIAIIDLHPSALHHNKFSVLASFSAHHDNIACMAFAPSGLRIASCDTHGQTILVHALCAAGSLTHNNTLAEVQTDGSKLHVQLLYKLMRGISLSTIVHINFDSSESLLAAATLNGTLHIFSMDRTHESDNRYYHSSRSNSDTSSTNEHETIGPSSWTAPITDVNQLLQLSRAETRLLYGYSELRVKLPLRDASQTREEELKSSWNPIPVNVVSQVTMYRCNDGGEGIYDLFSVTNEGMLCRYRINAPPSGSQTSSSALSSRELHRFDLASLFDISDSFVHDSDRDGSSIEQMKKNAWLQAASDTPEPVELPMWFRPQMRLRSQSKGTKGLKKNILFAEQQDSSIMRIQRFGPPLSTQKEKTQKPPKSKLPPHPPVEVGIESVIRDAVNATLESAPHEPIEIKTYRNTTYEDLSTWEMDIDWEESDADSKS